MKLIVVGFMLLIALVCFSCFNKLSYSLILITLETPIKAPPMLNAFDLNLIWTSEHYLEECLAAPRARSNKPASRVLRLQLLNCSTTASWYPTGFARTPYGTVATRATTWTSALRKMPPTGTTSLESRYCPLEGWKTALTSQSSWQSGCCYQMLIIQDTA